MSSRRTFLTRASGGLLGLFGFLLPQKLWACHRGPLFGSRVAASSGVCDLKPLAVVSGDFVIDFPDERTVFGHGGFYAWGTTVNANIFATKATCGSVTVTPLPTPPRAIPGNSWAFLFDDVGTNPVIFTIYGTDKTDMSNPVDAKKGYFSFTPGSI
jgi:hypothetical protein